MAKAAKTPAKRETGKAPDAQGPKPVNLALQGGGAHGAFTWGVLDRLLADGRLKISAISGTSAGAMNAVVVADGWSSGGAEGARAALKDFWRKVSWRARLSPIQRLPGDVLWGNWSLDLTPSYLAFDVMSRFASPYLLNPLNYNPLREVVEEAVDFDRVRACGDIRLFVAATNVRTGKIKVFSGDEIGLDAVMASACLPQIYQAVEIDGEAYWDGGFMGNPPIFPLFYEADTADTVLVQINPIERADVPRTAREILSRVNEITFNSTLLRELRAIEFVSRLLDDGRLDADRYTRVRLHRIHGNHELAELSASSKVNAEWAFLKHLRDIGRRMAGDWLDENFDAIGERGTIDLRDEIT
ncbi:patatin-like phospholipase family protein [Rhodobium gokarnense]|uniref:NTE family protein n=1 Tax=Rhodobium gokarnense TaxID=364296 RepID=A0ABT3H8K7_9HYPH|nr:patatin-like phospholipase family protein [Rhodobium gokarnense]MCW2306716.1 NTE family protein [Rhodobium gokarnense]